LWAQPRPAPGAGRFDPPAAPAAGPARAGPAAGRRRGRPGGERPVPGRGGGPGPARPPRPPLPLRPDPARARGRGRRRPVPRRRLLAGLGLPGALAGPLPRDGAVAAGDDPHAPAPEPVRVPGVADDVV